MAERPGSWSNISTMTPALPTWLSTLRTARSFMRPHTCAGVRGGDSTAAERIAPFGNRPMAAIPGPKWMGRVGRIPKTGSTDASRFPFSARSPRRFLRRWKRERAAVRARARRLTADRSAAAAARRRQPRVNRAVVKAVRRQPTRQVDVAAGPAKEAARRRPEAISTSAAVGAATVLPCLPIPMPAVSSAPTIAAKRGISSATATIGQCISARSAWIPSM